MINNFGNSKNKIISAVNEILNSNEFIESHEIFKKYPSTLDIKIKKTKLLAKINRDGKLLFIGSNGKFLKNEKSNFQLPFIFGNPEVKDFLKLKSIIDESNIQEMYLKNNCQELNIKLDNIKKVIKIKPDEPFAYQFLASVLKNQDKITEMIKIVDEGLEKNLINKLLILIMM